MTDFFINKPFQEFIVTCLVCENAEEFEGYVLHLKQKHYGVDVSGKVPVPVIFENIEAVIDHIEHIEPYEPIKTYNYEDYYRNIDKQQEAIADVYDKYIVTKKYIKSSEKYKDSPEFPINLQEAYYKVYANANANEKNYNEAFKKFQESFWNVIKNIDVANNTIIDRDIRFTNIIEHSKLKEYYNSSHPYNGVPPVEKREDFDLQLKQCLVSNTDHHGKLFLYKGGSEGNDICIAMATMWNQDPQLQGETYNRNTAAGAFQTADIEYGIKKYKDYRLTYKLSLGQDSIKDIWASKYVNIYNIEGTSKQTISYVCENISETLRDIQRSEIRGEDHKYKTTQAYNNYIKRLLGEPIVFSEEQQKHQKPEHFKNNHHKKHALVIPPKPGKAAEKAAEKAKVKAIYEELRPARELEEIKQADAAKKKYEKENPEALKTPKHMKEGMKRIKREEVLARKEMIRHESPEKRKVRKESEKKEKEEEKAAKVKKKEQEKAAKAKVKEERIAAKKKEKEAKAKPKVGTSFNGAETQPRTHTQVKPLAKSLYLDVVPTQLGEGEGAYLEVGPSANAAYLDVVPAPEEEEEEEEEGAYLDVGPLADPTYLMVEPSGKSEAPAAAAKAEAEAAAAAAQQEEDIFTLGFPNYSPPAAAAVTPKTDCQNTRTLQCWVPKVKADCHDECIKQAKEMSDFEEGFGLEEGGEEELKGFGSGGSRKHNGKSKGSKRHFLGKNTFRKRHFLGKSVSKKKNKKRHFLGKNTFRKSVGKKRKSVSKKKKRHFLGKSVSKKHFLGKNTFRKSVVKKKSKRHFLGKNTFRHFLGKSVSKKTRKNKKSVSKNKKSVSKKKKSVGKKGKSVSKKQ